MWFGTTDPAFLEVLRKMVPGGAHCQNPSQHKVFWLDPVELQRRGIKLFRVSGHKIQF